MTGVVVAFPERHAGNGERWEPWVEERVVARHFGVQSADSAALARGRDAFEIDRRKPPVQDLRGRDLAREEIRMSYRQKPNGSWVVEVYDRSIKRKAHVARKRPRPGGAAQPSAKRRRSSAPL